LLTNTICQRHLIEALIRVYIEAEKTGYYEKFRYRFFSVMVMEFVWGEHEFRAQFIDLNHKDPGLFVEFCNFLINDVNNDVFEGLLALEHIKEWEELQEGWHLLS